MTSPARPRGRPPLADDAIRERAMRLRDAGCSLRYIAEQLKAERPEVFDKAPSAASVSTWADQAEQEYAAHALTPPMMRARRVRRLETIMGEFVAEMADCAGDLDKWWKFISAHVLLERELTRLFPTRMELELPVPPGVDPATRAKIAATYGEPPRTPIRGVS